MANLNRVLLIGNLTRDPEMRYIPSGKAVADIGIAVNRSYSGDDGGKKEDVTFVDVVLWGRLAEIAEQYLKKGRPVFIEGRLQLDSWTDKGTGQKRSRLRVVAENMQMLRSRGETEGGSAPASGQQRRTAAPTNSSQFTPTKPSETESPF